MGFLKLLPRLNSCHLSAISYGAGLVAATGVIFHIWRRSRPCRGLNFVNGFFNGQEKEFPDDVMTLQEITEPTLQLLPVHFYPFCPGPLNLIEVFWPGEVDRTPRTIWFLLAGQYGSASKRVKTMFCYLSVSKGQTTDLSWMNFTRKVRNPQGFPRYMTVTQSSTSIQLVSGMVTQYISLRRVRSAVNVPVGRFLHKCYTEVLSYVCMGLNGQVSSGMWMYEKSFLTPFRRVSFLGSDPDIQSNPQDGVSSRRLCLTEGTSPEWTEVPFIIQHLTVKGVSDILLKLCSLRKAFSTLLSDIFVQNFLFVQGKKVLRVLVKANKKDEIAFIEAYHSLIGFLRCSSNQQAISRELSLASVQHLNFLDLLFELVLFRLFSHNRPPVASEGGFLERLFSVIRTWDTSDSWEPAAEHCFQLLTDQLKLLLEELFSQPLELYCNPDSLVTVVHSLLKHHLALAYQKVSIIKEPLVY